MRYGRADDEAMLYVLSLHDEGYTFDFIADQIQRDRFWCEKVCIEVFMEERATAQLH